MFDYFLLFVVGVIWGTTDYMIENYFRNYEEIDESNFIKKAYTFVIKNYRPICCFLINQSGSLIFYYTMRTLSMSLTVMVTNSVCFLTATLCEIIHKKKKMEIKFFIGMICVMIGMGICLHSDKKF